MGSTAWMEYWQEDSEKFGGQFMAINVAYHDSRSIEHYLSMA